jgi:hypothetical protein
MGRAIPLSGVSEYPRSVAQACAHLGSQSHPFCGLIPAPLRGARVFPFDRGFSRTRLWGGSARSKAKFHCPYRGTTPSKHVDVSKFLAASLASFVVQSAVPAVFLTSVATVPATRSGIHCRRSGAGVRRRAFPTVARVSHGCSPWCPAGCRRTSPSGCDGNESPSRPCDPLALSGKA